MNTLKKYKVSVFGESYTLISDESEDHMNSAVAKVDMLMRQIATQTNVTDSKRIAVLVALQLASQLHGLQERVTGYGNKELELIRSIDRELEISSL